jgi:hypothetical protein
MVTTGIGQLMAQQTGPGGMNALTQLGYPAYIASLLGICKMAGVIILLMPGRPVLKEWVYSGFFFMMAVAVYSHLQSGHGVIDALPAAFLLVLTICSWFLRPAGRKLAI